MVQLEFNMPSSFYEPEERYGFQITREKKELWAVELDLLHKFISICKKYGLKWWVDNGTLLGTARDGHFIPWDDDIDISMYRGDYDIFIQNAPQELNYPYFLQTPISDLSATSKTVSLMRLDTTMITLERLSTNFSPKSGIRIEIHVYDGLPEQKTFVENTCQDIDTAFKLMLFEKMNYRLGKINDSICRGKCNYYWKLLYDILTLKSYSGAENLVRYVDYYNEYNEKFIIPSEILNDKFITLEFEGLEVSCPACYEQLLEHFYGKNWREPIVEDGSNPTYYFDTNNPYTMYLN